VIRSRACESADKLPPFYNGGYKIQKPEVRRLVSGFLPTLAGFKA
jgi:hypothetical protein